MLSDYTIQPVCQPQLTYAPILLATLRCSCRILACADKDMMGAKYWHFNVNHLGQQDIEAQLDFIHTAKCAELPKELAEAAHAADVLRRRPRYRCRPLFYSYQWEAGADHYLLSNCIKHRSLFPFCVQLY